MSFTIVNGRRVESLDSDLNSDLNSDSDSLVSDYKSKILFADNTGNICFKIEELDEQPSSFKKTNTLGKRKLTDAFGEDYCDEERYGQVVGDKFFENNIGHNVVQER
jgi:hypothetical protein